MSFPRYPKYKDSGVEWLGELPEHWDVWKIAHAFETIGSGTTPKSDNRDYYEGGDIPWINTGDLNDAGLDECAKRVTSLAMTEHTSLKLFPAGSLLIAMYGATIGKLAILSFPATVNQACCVFSGASPIASKFMFYWFLGLRQQILSLATGGGQPNVSQDILRTLRVGCPDEEEQNQIAKFLDSETSKIDALVGEQRRLIELLKEKRQAVISHAVTKGLNPNAPLKPSGIEWLGDVPQHWEVPPLYTRYEQVLGKMLDQNKMTGEHPIPYVRNVDVQWDKVNTEDLPTIDIRPDELERFTIKNGDLLVCEGGEVGRTAIWNSGDNKVAFQKALHRLRPITSTECPRYFYYIMCFATGMNVFIANSNPNTIPHLTGEQIRVYRFPKPPGNEQTEIANFLDAESEKLDALTAEAERGIELLQERRTALISAAVTGKIDVRDFTSMEAVA